MTGARVAEAQTLQAPQWQVVEPFKAILDKVLLPYQRDDVLSADRFRWNCWSRQTGKSFTKSLRRIIRGISRNRSQFFLSAGGRQSRELMLKARQHCENLRLAFDFHEETAGMFDGTSYTQMEIRLPEMGIRIVGLPANPETARGFTGDVFLDEFAMHRYDREIWGAMFPSIMRGGGELDVASTPKGKQNKFYELAENPQFAHDTVTIHDAIGRGLTGVDPEQLRLAMGDDLLFRQEFLCEFVDEATAFITLEMIRGCEDEELPRDLDVKALHEHKGDVLIGVDVGRFHDLTVIWALDSIGSQLISRGLIEMAAMSFRSQYEMVSEIMECNCVRRCGIDASGLGMQLSEQLAERYGEYRVEGHTFTANLKEEMAGKLRVKMEGGLLAIPVDRAIREDLHSIEKSVTIDGKIRLRAPRKEGSHADRFWALALAVYAAADGGGPIECELGPVLPMASARRL
jgi:phage FluMu gp28-like protein